MDSSLPFQSIKGRTFRGIYRSGKRALELEDIWAGRKHVRNEWTQTLLIESRRQYYKGSCKENLSILFRQPVEIIYEIFGHLHPMDLYHLFRTTDILTTTFFPRRVSWLWQRVFDRHPEVPTKPLDIDYPEWADLLFGPFNCDECKAPGVPPNWISKRRLCRQCSKKRDDQVMDCASIFQPEELGGGRWDYDVDERKFYADFVQLWFNNPPEPVSTYLEFPVDLSPPGWVPPVFELPLTCHLAFDMQDFADHLVAFLRYDYQAALAKMKEEPMLKFLLNYFIQYHAICLGWTQSIDEIKREQRYRQRQRIDSWGQRKTGYAYNKYAWNYLLESLDRFWIMSQVDKRHPFRDLRRRWKRHLPNISTYLEEWTSNMDERGELDRLLTRKAEIEEVHNLLYDKMTDEYLKHSEAKPPIPGDVLPTAAEVLLYEPFVSMLCAKEPDFDEPDLDTINDYTMKFRALVQKRRPETMKDLAELSPMIAVPKCMEHHPNVKTSSAAAIFYCLGCRDGIPILPGLLGPSPPWSKRLFFGWKSMIKHLNVDRCHFLKLPHPFKVHERASQASWSAIRMYQQNPAVIEEEDMKWLQDQEDIRLACLNCPEIVRSGMAMRWEDCINHAVLFEDDPAHAESKWQKVHLSRVIRRDITKVFT